MSEEKIVNKNTYNFIKVVGYCTIPRMIMIVLITIILTFINTTTVSSPILIVLAQQSLPVFVGYCILPVFTFLRLEKEPIETIGIRRSNKWIFFICFAVTIVWLCFLFFRAVGSLELTIYSIHYLFVAISEEVLVRGIILFYLSKIFRKKWVAVIVSALIFALVFHSTDAVIDNLIWRVPFGIVTAFLYMKTKTLVVPILFHWIYNTGITVLYI